MSNEIDYAKEYKRLMEELKQSNTIKQKISTGFKDDNAPNWVKIYHRKVEKELEKNEKQDKDNIIEY